MTRWIAGAAAIALAVLLAMILLPEPREQEAGPEQPVMPSTGSEVASVVAAASATSNHAKAMMQPALGRVQDVHGIPVSGAVITWAEGGPHCSTTSNGKGEFMVPVGAPMPAYWPLLTVKREGFADFADAGASELKGQRTITLTPIDDGKNYILVRVRSEDGPAKGRTDILLQEHWSRAHNSAVVADQPSPDGAVCALIEVPDDCVDLTVRNLAYASWTAKQLEVGSTSRMEPLLVEATLKRGCRIFGTLTDLSPPDAGAETVRVAAYHKGMGWALIGDAERVVTRGGDAALFTTARHADVLVQHGGSCEFEITGVGEGTYRIAAVDERGDAIRMPVTIESPGAGDIGPVAVVVGGGTNITLRVTLGASAVPIRATLYPCRFDQQGNPQRTSATAWSLSGVSLDGCVRISNVPPGLYSVRIRLPSEAHLESVRAVSSWLWSALEQLIASVGTAATMSEPMRVENTPVDYTVDLVATCIKHNEWKVFQKADTQNTRDTSNRDIEQVRPLFNEDDMMQIDRMINMIRNGLRDLEEIALASRGQYANTPIGKATAARDSLSLLRIAFGLDKPW